MQKLSDRTAGFTDSVIRRMTRVSNQYDAINLSQGLIASTGADSKKRASSISHYLGSAKFSRGTGCKTDPIYGAKD